MKRRLVIPRMPRLKLSHITVTRRMKRIAFAVLALAVVVAAAGIAHGPVVRVLARTGNPLLDLDKSAWVWDATLIAPPAAQTAAPSPTFIERLTKLNINRLFLNAGWDKSVREPYLAARPAEYDQFIKAAQARGIKVEALYGEPNFAKAEHWPELLRHVNLVLDYNKQHANRFSALHLDIEPYGCADYRGNEATILRDYLAAMRQVKELLRQHNAAERDQLKLVLDLPVWWTAEAPVVDGQPLVPQLLSLADEVVVMNYTADGDRFISQGLRWLAAAKGATARVSMGMEFQPETRGATLSALTASEVQLYVQSAQKEFRSSRQFAGFAVHHFEPFDQYCLAISGQGKGEPR